MVIPETTTAEKSERIVMVIAQRLAATCGRGQRTTDRERAGASLRDPRNNRHGVIADDTPGSCFLRVPGHGV